MQIRGKVLNLIWQWECKQQQQKKTEDSMDKESTEYGRYVNKQTNGETLR